MDSHVMFSLLLEDAVGIKKRPAAEKSKFPKKKRKKAKVLKKIDREAQKKFREALKKVKGAKSRGRGAISLLMAVTASRTISERDGRLVKKTCGLLRKRKGFSVKIETRSIPSAEDLGDDPDEMELKTYNFATQLVITGFGKS